MEDQAEMAHSLRFFRWEFYKPEIDIIFMKIVTHVDVIWYTW
jgi:hypothetical protein